MTPLCEAQRWAAERLVCLVDWGGSSLSMHRRRDEVEVKRSIGKFLWGSNDESSVTLGTDRRRSTPRMGMTGILCWSPNVMDNRLGRFHSDVPFFVVKGRWFGKGPDCEWGAVCLVCDDRTDSIVTRISLTVSGQGWRKE